MKFNNKMSMETEAGNPIQSWRYSNGKAVAGKMI